MKYDVILVLAGGLTDEGALPISVKYRVLAAKILLDKKVSSKIIVSGKWGAYWDRNLPRYTEASLMAKYAYSLGLPKKSVYVEENSQNTFENIFYTNKMFIEPKNLKKVLIITSDFHVRRVNSIVSKILCERCEVDVVGVKSDFGLIKKLKLQLKEYLLSHSHWFFQYFSNY